MLYNIFFEPCSSVNLLGYLEQYKCLELRLIESAFSLVTAGITFRHLTGHINKLGLNCEEDSVSWVLFLLMMGQFDLQCRPSLHVSQKNWPQR